MYVWWFEHAKSTLLRPFYSFRLGLETFLLSQNRAIPQCFLNRHHGVSFPPQVMGTLRLYSKNKLPLRKMRDSKNLKTRLFCLHCATQEYKLYFLLHILSYSSPSVDWNFWNYLQQDWRPSDKISKSSDRSLWWNLRKTI